MLDHQLRKIPPQNLLGYENFPPFSIAENAQQIKLELPYDHDAGRFLVFYYQDNAKFPLFFTASGYRIENMLNLDQGKAWIGFTSATFGATAAAYIYQFQFQSLPTVSAGVAIICPPDLVVTASARTCTYSGTTGTPTLINLYGGSSVSKSPVVLIRLELKLSSMLPPIRLDTCLLTAIKL